MNNLDLNERPFLLVIKKESKAKASDKHRRENTPTSLIEDINKKLMKKKANHEIIIINSATKNVLEIKKVFSLSLTTTIR